MIEKIDKRMRAAQFRTRLAQAIQAKAISQSALARAIGVDRSTISQLLKDTGARLPNAQVVGACASALDVSSDWLLSLSDRPENAASLLANSMVLTPAARALVDEQIFSWHQEAAGYKIRHVPASLPDMLKTNEMLEWEYTPHLGRSAQQAIQASQDRLNWMRAARSDYEIACPLHELESFASASGYYSGLPRSLRHQQLDRLQALYTQFYPRLRFYLFDARRVYSAPLTIFGPLMAAVYVGHNYLVFRDSQRVTAFTEHFDNLVRAADIGARTFPDKLAALRALVHRGGPPA